MTYLKAGVIVLVGGLMSCTAQNRGDVSANATTASDASPEIVSQRTVSGNLELLNVPDIPQALREKLLRYQNTRSARFAGFLGNERLITTRFAETSQLFLVRKPLGAREQITFFAEPVGEVAVPRVADPNGFVYARDIGGSEFYQLFYYDLASRDSRLLTDGHSRYGNVRWYGGSKFAYTTTERNSVQWDIHVQTLTGDGFAKTVAFESESGAWSALDWSPDGSRILAMKYVSINESYLYEIDVATQKAAPLLDESVVASIGSASYGKNGKRIFFVSDLGAEFMRLHTLDLTSGKVDVLTSDVAWNVEAFSLSDDGHHIALSVNENGVSRVTVQRLNDGQLLGPVALPQMPRGITMALAFAPDSKSLIVSANGATFPADVYEIALDARKLMRWTRSEVGGINLDHLIAPELIEYPTFDRDGDNPRRIPAFVFRPRSSGPHPVVILIHGGPEGQYRPYFSSTVQYLVNELGVAVIAPNVRGSNGYGKSFLKLDNGFKREDSVKDIGALLDWIAVQDDMDTGRVAVFGGSYGGYMVLASMVHYGKRLAAGVETVGISNFVTFLENTQGYRQDLRREEYGDERDPKMRAHLQAISPLNHVERMSKPMMISQGLNDPRVPAGESEQIVAMLAEEKVPVWYVLARDEGHGFRKKRNRDFNTAATMLFFERYLVDR